MDFFIIFYFIFSQDDNDISLTKCVYFLYAWGGGFKDGHITMHKNKAVSQDMICIGKIDFIFLCKWTLVHPKLDLSHGSLHIGSHFLRHLLSPIEFGNKNL